MYMYKSSKFVDLPITPTTLPTTRLDESGLEIEYVVTGFHILWPHVSFAVHEVVYLLVNTRYMYALSNFLNKHCTAFCHICTYIVKHRENR